MAPRASRPKRRDRNLSPGPSMPPTGVSLLSRCRALYFPTRPRLSPWTTLEQPHHHLLRGLRSWVPPCPLWSPVVSVLTPLCKGAVPLPPHPRIGESGLLVSLSLDKPGALRPRLLGTEIPELQPPRPPQPRPPHQRRLRRAPLCAPAQQFLPTGQVAGEEGGDRPLGPPPQQPGSGGRGDNRSNSSRGRRERPACPARSRGIRPSGPRRPHPRKTQHDDPPALPSAPPVLPPGGQAPLSPV